MKRIIYVLGLLFINQNFAYAQEKDSIQITEKKLIKGYVVDYDNTPLTDAIIKIKGTEYSVRSDAEGTFKLQNMNDFPVVLEVNKKGYQKSEVILDEYQPTITIKLNLIEKHIEAVLVTSRRRSEEIQKIPIPITVLTAKKIDDTGSFTVNRLKELVPTVQLYASNARNTTLNIRGLGSTFGLTNDGIDPGVGFYVDGVYYARPAATALDFIDTERIEVLRGPQGTLFGKNTTAGAFNITTKDATFRPTANFEISGGNYGFLQAKGSLSGPISKKLAARISFSGTQRNGLLYNVHTQDNINDINNIGVRTQFLYKPTDNIKVTLNADITDQKPDGYGWPVAGVVTTKRAAYRQFYNIIKDLNYEIPYNSAFERKVDLDTPSKADNQLGGVSLNADFKLGKGTLTSTSAFRYWKWTPLNDRDYIGLPVFTISSGNSVHKQWSQEIRYSGNLTEKLHGVIGVFGLWQDLNSDPVQTEEAGSAQWRFAQDSTSSLWSTPGLFDNFGIRTTNRIQSTSLAIFSQVDWAITEKFHILPGVRYNYDKKIANYKRETYGGLQTTDPALIALKNKVYTNQAFDTDAKEGNFSGQLTLQYNVNNNFNTFATYSLSYKPVGVNIGGLPTANGQVLIDLAKIKPESVRHFEVGVKTKPTPNSIFNVVFFNDDIKDYQTQVQTPEPGVNRGYLANAEKVNVKGVEIDGNIRIQNFVFNAALAYTEGKYVKFTNAPVPLEEVGGSLAFKDVSGGRLPGISKWSGSFGAEDSFDGHFLGFEGSYFVGADVFFRSNFSSSPSPSQYLNISGYYLVNSRVGFRASNGLSINLWARNLFNKDYYEQLLAAPGSAGHYAGVIGDPATFGVTLKYTLK